MKGSCLISGSSFTSDLISGSRLALNSAEPRVPFCTLCTWFSACREGTRCTQDSHIFVCREDRACTPRSCLSACREGRGCTSRTCVSPCREDTGCTPCTGVPASRAGTASFPMPSLPVSRRVPRATTCARTREELSRSLRGDVFRSLLGRTPRYYKQCQISETKILRCL